MDLGGSWTDGGLRLGTMNPNWNIGSHLWSFQIGVLAGDQADIAKTHKNLWFSKVLDGWNGIMDAWRSSGLRAHTLDRIWLAGGMAGWGLAGAGWQAG